jgi:hypothetical protein
MFALTTCAAYPAAQRTTPDGKEPGVEVRAAIAALAGYNQALIGQDYARLRDRFVHAPFVVVDDAPRVIATVDTVVEGLRKTRESLAAAGYATTKLSTPRVSLLRSDRFVRNCRLRHLKKDGSSLGERANFYLMVNEAGVWKVGGIILQDPAYFDKWY